MRKMSQTFDTSMTNYSWKIKKQFVKYRHLWRLFLQSCRDRGWQFVDRKWRGCRRRGWAAVLTLGRGGRWSRLTVHAAGRRRTTPGNCRHCVRSLTVAPHCWESPDQSRAGTPATEVWRKHTTHVHFPPSMIHNRINSAAYWCSSWM